MRRVVFVRGAADIPPPSDGTTIVVLDSAWTPPPGARSDVVPIRAAIVTVAERDDLFEEALERLDAWAAATGIADRLLVDGSSAWFRIRERCWWWVHERLFWLRVVDEIAGPRTAAPDELRVPVEEVALADVARRWAVGRQVRFVVETSGSATSADPVGAGAAPVWAERLRWLAGWPARRVRRRARLVRSSAIEGRLHVLDERVRELRGGDRARVLVLSHTGIFQPIRGASRAEPIDPILGPVVERLTATGFDVVVVGLGLDHRRDGDWETIRADPGLLPSSLLAARWSAPDDDAASGTGSASPALDGAEQTAIDVDGVDLAPPLVEEIRSVLAASQPTALRHARQAARLLTEIRPAALLLTHEGIRGPWLQAAQERRVPSFAVQHGVIYPTHPGYRHARHPGLLLPDCTFTYGDFERRVLLDHGGYRTDEVVASGSPRLDLDRAARIDAAPAEAASVRRELGVAEGDRMLVVSTVNLPFVRRTYVTAMLARALGGPLPGVHVVFKTHPGEEDEGPYRVLLESLARGGGYAPPPMTVVRRVDLYRLLRAADAHLGLHSTVLTDAVAAGTPNLIFVAQVRHDVLGYVAAGVARPVRGVADVRAALDHPVPADPAARDAFLARHFRAGDASGRIVGEIEDRLVGHHPSAGSTRAEGQGADG